MEKVPRTSALNVFVVASSCLDLPPGGKHLDLTTCTPVIRGQTPPSQRHRPSEVKHLDLNIDFIGLSCNATLPLPS